MKIYTKTGDNGTTGLFAGPRVLKSHPRISAYGTIDELNAVLGVIAAEHHVNGSGYEDDLDKELSQLLERIQSDLFSIGAQLATPEPQSHGMCLLAPERTTELESYLDRLEAILPPLSSFVLPGGTPASARLHLARTVCRRAERDVVAFAVEDEPASTQPSEQVIVYLNRLSDLLFMMARRANQVAGIADKPWKSPATSD
ncbi:MAG: cob(I)yrinic acid a,c-diamide adenosyltransferase [Pirellulaceae bacterium]